MLQLCWLAYFIIGKAGGTRPKSANTKKPLVKAFFPMGDSKTTPPPPAKQHSNMAATEDSALPGDSPDAIMRSRSLSYVLGIAGFQMQYCSPFFGENHQDRVRIIES